MNLQLDNSVCHLVTAEISSIFTSPPFPPHNALEAEVALKDNGLGSLLSKWQEWSNEERKVQVSFVLRVLMHFRPALTGLFLQADWEFVYFQSVHCGTCTVLYSQIVEAYLLGGMFLPFLLLVICICQYIFDFMPACS